MTSPRCSPTSISTRRRWRRQAPERSPPMRVLGSDPGTATVGYGVVERSASLGAVARLVECGILRTRPREALQQRLATIHEGLHEPIERHRPAGPAVEDIFYATNVRTTIVLGHARGVILLAGAQAGLVVAEYSPALVKKTVVGRGGGGKPRA